MTLSVSKGVTERVTESVVRAEPQPTFTESWHPFSHAIVLDAVAAACKKFNLTIKRKEYSIRKNSKMFASWEVRSAAGILMTQEKEFDLAIGIRNSIDKTHSVGLCAGERITVCDNLMFSGDFVIFRKHTGRLEIEEIVFYAEEALEALLPKMNEFHDWHEKLKAIKLTYDQASLLTVAAMKQDLIPSSKFPQFYDLFYARESRYATTLHGWHGAATEIMRENSLLTIQWKNERLNKFIDYQAPVLISKAATNLEWIEESAEKQFQKDKAARKATAREQLSDIRQRAQDLKFKKKATPKRSEKRRETISRSRKKDTRKKKKGAQNKKVSARDLEGCSRAPVLRKLEEKAKEKVHMKTERALKKADKKFIKKLNKSIAEQAVKKAESQDQLPGKKTVKVILNPDHEKLHKMMKKKKGAQIAKVEEFTTCGGLAEKVAKNSIMKCPFCNAVIVKGQKSCPACGESLS